LTYVSLGASLGAQQMPLSTIDTQVQAQDYMRRHSHTVSSIAVRLTHDT